MILKIGDLLLEYSCFLKTNIFLQQVEEYCVTSTFRSELVLIRIVAELTMEICYNLRTLGVPIDGLAQIMRDNDSLVTS